MLVDSLRADMNNQLQSTLVDAMLMFQQHDPPIPEVASTTSGSANSMASSITLDTLINTIKGLQHDITTLENTPSTPPSNSEINPKTGKPWKYYYWTHGCCPHSSKSCPDKMTGHKDEVTFKNRLGDSNKNCLDSG